MAQPLLCSIADVKARTTVTLGDAALTALVESVSNEMEDHVSAWLAPRSTLTLLFDVERTGPTLRLQLANRRVGIRALTALGTAIIGQPESGGTYTTVPLASALLRPRPTEDIQASAIVLVSPYTFTRGFNTVTATGDWGPPAVLPLVRETAIELVLFGLGNGQNVSSETVGDWSVDYDSSARQEIMSKLDSLMTFTF